MDGSLDSLVVAMAAEAADALDDPEELDASAVETAAATSIEPEGVSTLTAAAAADASAVEGALGALVVLGTLGTLGADGYGLVGIE